MRRCLVSLSAVATVLLATLALDVSCAPAPKTPTTSRPASNARKPWRFAVFDDSRASEDEGWTNDGVSTFVVGKIAEALVNEGDVEVVVFPGDMVTGETDDVQALTSMMDTWIAAMAPVYKAGIQVLVTRGNHEYNPRAKGAKNPKDPSGSGPFRTKFAMPDNGPPGEHGLTYSVIHKNALFIGFDQYAGRSEAFDNTVFDGSKNSGQMMSRWVTDEIARSAAPITFAFAHEQLFPSASHPDCMANDPASRDALVDALAEKNGAYFCGHDHLYAHVAVTASTGRTVPEFVVGTAGGGNYDYRSAAAPGYAGAIKSSTAAAFSDSRDPYYGYLVVTVSPDNGWKPVFKAARKSALAAGKTFQQVDPKP